MLTICMRQAAGNVAPEMALNCTQGPVPAGVISIGCIGDSITAGVHSTGTSKLLYGGTMLLMPIHKSESEFENIGTATTVSVQVATTPTRANCKSCWMRPTPASTK